MSKIEFCRNLMAVAVTATLSADRIRHAIALLTISLGCFGYFLANGYSAAVVQSVHNTYGGSTNTLSVTFTKPEIAGDTVVAQVPHGTTSVGDNNGETFTVTSTAASGDIWTATKIKGATWKVTTLANFPTTNNPSMTATEYAASSAIQPSVSLPSNYKLAWNQDFTAPSYSPFNVPANVSLNGPPTSIWKGIDGIANTNMRVRYSGTEGDPFSTAKGYLNIHANGTGPFTAPYSNPYGGQIQSGPGGFTAANAYWESKILLPVGGKAQWPAFWLRGENTSRGEIDIMEFGYQIPGQTNGSFQIHLHTWPGGASAGDYAVNSLTVTPGGWHIFGCLVQPGTVSIYLDGALVHRFTGLSSVFSLPMEVRLDFGFGPGFPTSGDTGNMSVQYVRCWTPQ
jgi:hypothetical protein